MKKKTRQLLSVVLALIMVISVLPIYGIISFADAEFGGDHEQFQFGDFKYYFNNDKITITISDYIGSTSELEIPSEIDGHIVTGIGDCAFMWCDSLTSIIIPNSVTSIGLRAFTYCVSLTDITVDKNNKGYSSDSYGVLFNKDKTTLIQYPIGNAILFSITQEYTSLLRAS